jgi:DHA2 family multidrug resistance protein-like MFS transporter
MNATLIEPKATRREWIGLAVLALPCLLYSMDLTVLNLAVPNLSADLKPSSTQLLWIIDIYGFLVAGSLVTMGTLGDRIGRRRLLMYGATAFGGGSVLAALSNSAEMLIATRALLGVAGATLAPSTLSLIRNMFLDAKQRQVAIGVWITSYSVGAAIGPLIGGVLLEFFWWGSVFLVSVPVMVLLLILGPRLLPEFRDPNAGKLDIVSAVLSLATVLPVIYGLKQLAIEGAESVPLLSIAAGLLAGAMFVYRQLNMPEPMIDLRLFRVPAFSASLSTYLLGALAAFGAFVFIAQYLQLVKGLSPLEAGVWTLPWALSFVVASNLTPILARRYRPAVLMSAGAVLSAVGFVILTQIEADSGAAAVIAASVISSLGLAPVFTLATDLMIGSAPPERAGAAAAISETCAEFGGAMGIAILGSIGTAIYRSQMEDGAGSLSPESAATARDTLGGALAVAETLPVDTGAILTEFARVAFVSGLQVTALVGAVVALIMAAITWGLLRNVAPSTEAEPSA